MARKIVVAGASGNVGSLAVQALAQMEGVEIKALTRSSDSEKLAPLRSLKNVQIVECDISNKTSLAGVFGGVDAAFLTCGNFRGQVEAEKTFIDEAVSSGCPYLVKLGTVRSYTSKDSLHEYARFHAEIEEHLEKAAGATKWTVLCPNWFMSNHLADIFGTLPMGIIAYPLDPEAVATIVDPRDIGEMAAQLLTAADPTPYHRLKLDVAGPEALSMSQVAALYTKALGRRVQLVKPSLEEWVAAGVKAGMPEWLATAVSHNFGKWERGDLKFTSTEAPGIQPPKRTMADWINEWAPRSPPPVDAPKDEAAEAP